MKWRYRIEIWLRVHPGVEVWVHMGISLSRSAYLTRGADLMVHSKRLREVGWYQICWEWRMVWWQHLSFRQKNWFIWMDFGLIFFLGLLYLSLDWGSFLFDWVILNNFLNFITTAWFFLNSLFSFFISKIILILLFLDHLTILTLGVLYTALLLLRLLVRGELGLVILKFLDEQVNHLRLSQGFTRSFHEFFATGK